MNARRFLILVMVSCMALVATECGGGSNPVTYRKADCQKAKLTISHTATWHDNGGNTGPIKASVVVTCNGVPASDVDVKIVFPGGSEAKITTDAAGAGSASKRADADPIPGSVRAEVICTDGTQTATASIVQR